MKDELIYFFLPGGNHAGPEESDFFLVLQAPVAKKKLTSSTFKKSLANIIYPKQIRDCRSGPRLLFWGDWICNNRFLPKLNNKPTWKKRKKINLYEHEEFICFITEITYCWQVGWSAKSVGWEIYASSS